MCEESPHHDKPPIQQQKGKEKEKKNITRRSPEQHLLLASLLLLVHGGDSISKVLADDGVDDALSLGLLEAVEVVHVTTELTLLDLLSPGGLLPRLHDLVVGKSLLDTLGVAATGDADSEAGHGKTTDRDAHAGNTSGGAIDDDTVGIDDVNDDSSLAGAGTEGDDSKTTDLDERSRHVDYK